MLIVFHGSMEVKHPAGTTVPFVASIVISIVMGTTVFSRAVYAEIAVIPYRIMNPSVFLKPRTGREYAKLLSVALLVKKKGVSVTSPRDIERDCERYRLGGETPLTASDLNLLGRTRRIEYFLSGTLLKSGKGYRSKSILYSVKEQRVILKSDVRAEDLFRLAQKEIAETMTLYRDADIGSGRRGVDALFLIDSSYSIKGDETSIKEGVVSTARLLIDKMGRDTRIYILPFSDRGPSQVSRYSADSLLAVRKALKGVRPRGNATGRGLEAAFRSAVKNVHWRRGADKIIVLISASPLRRSLRAERYALMAARGGIRIYCLTTGPLRGDERELYQRIAAIGGGINRDAAYFQRLYDADGGPVNIFYEDGRLFRAMSVQKGWLKGLYTEYRQGSRLRRPQPSYREIFYDEKKLRVRPYRLSDAFQRVTGGSIIRSEKTRSNIAGVIQGFFHTLSGTGGKGRAVMGRALLSDGKISIWISVPDKSFYNFFAEKKREGIYFSLGISVKKSAKQAYGISLVPRLKGITADYVPSLLSVPLKKLVKKSGLYMRQGLYHPPVWFIRVKVDELTPRRKGRDIRDF